MGILKLSTVSLTISFILGCSSQNADPPPPAKTVFDPLTQQIDHARAVQKTVDAKADDTRKTIDSQEGGDDPQRGAK
jgi:hypothetical protein